MIRILALLSMTSSRTLRASLATETEYVREQLAGYTNDLLSLGVDGLRLDAAKRMWSLSSCCFSQTPCPFRRHRTRRYRQYLGEIEDQAVHHPGGE